MDGTCRRAGAAGGWERHVLQSGGGVEFATSGRRIATTMLGLLRQLRSVTPPGVPWLPPSSQRVEPLLATQNAT